MKREVISVWQSWSSRAATTPRTGVNAMRRMLVFAALIGAVCVSGACSERSDSLLSPVEARRLDLPDGCESEPYTGEFGEGGEPLEDPGPGRTWYQGSDGRYYNCPQGGD